MTDCTRLNADGSCSSSTVHPEIAEASLACLKRDLRRLQQIKNRPFLRRPYSDVEEARMIALNPGSPPSDMIAGVAVYPVIKGDTNARIPLTIEQVQAQIASGLIVDLWTNRGLV